MLFPNDITLQRRWRVAKYLDIWDDIPPWAVADIRRNNDDPKPMQVRVRQAVWKGAVAGDILRLAASMAQQGHGGSVRQAVDVLRNVDYKTGKTLGRHNAPHNERTIRQAWSDYKSVAHLWAAYRHTLFLRSTPDYAEAGLTLATTPIFVEDAMLLYLTLAEAYRQFGLRHIAAKREKLQPPFADVDLWIVRTHTEPPWPWPQMSNNGLSFPVLPLTAAQEAALKYYRNLPNRH
jgi:hypothetical protein